MDIRFNLEDRGSEGGTGLDTHDKLERAQDGNETVPSSTEVGQ